MGGPLIDIISDGPCLKDTIKLLGVISQVEICRDYVQVFEYYTDEIHRVMYEMNIRCYTDNENDSDNNQ